MAVPPIRLPAERRRAKASDATRSDRRRAQKASQRDQKSQQYISIAQRLQFIADELDAAEDDDLRSDILKLVHRVRLRGGAPRKKDYEKVLDAVKLHQCGCVYDIQEETHLPSAVIRKIVEGLFITGQIELRGATYEDWDDYSLLVANNKPSLSSMVTP